MYSVVANKEPTRPTHLWIMTGACRNHRELPREFIGYVASMAAPQTEIRYLNVGARRKRFLFGFFRDTAQTISAFAYGLKYVRKGDMVVEVTEPPGAPFIAALIALVRGASYMLLWTEATGAKPGRSGGVFNTMVIREYVERWAYKHLTLIVVMQADLYAIAAGKTDGLDIPIVLLGRAGEMEFF